jgi:hypothetical protein
VNVYNFNCYPDGEVSKAIAIQATSTLNAAESFAKEARLDPKRSHGIIVVPADDAARVGAVPRRYGWHHDADDPAFALYTVDQPEIAWDVREVETLNPFGARARPDATPPGTSTAPVPAEAIPTTAAASHSDFPFEEVQAALHAAEDTGKVDGGKNAVSNALYAVVQFAMLRCGMTSEDVRLHIDTNIFPLVEHQAAHRAKSEAST